VDSDEHYELARRYDITAVPTVVILADGREVERFEGVTSAEVLRKSLLAAGANEAIADISQKERSVASAFGE
jgi:thioredoxin-like negative regulator of GroEL